MVRTTLATGLEVDDTRSIWDMGVRAKRKETQSSSSSRKKKKTSVLYGFQGQGRDYQVKAESGILARRGR